MIEVYSLSLLALAARRLGKSLTGFGGEKRLDGWHELEGLDNFGELELSKRL